VKPPPSNVNEKDAVPVWVNDHPPTGAVSLLVRVITVLDVIVPGKAANAVAKSGYVGASPDPPLVLTVAPAVPVSAKAAPNKAILHHCDVRRSHAVEEFRQFMSIDFGLVQRRSCPAFVLVDEGKAKAFCKDVRAVRKGHEG